jgi:hypothetical protein
LAFLAHEAGLESICECSGDIGIGFNQRPVVTGSPLEFSHGNSMAIRNVVQQPYESGSVVLSSGDIVR